MTNSFTISKYFIFIWIILISTVYVISQSLEKKILIETNDKEKDSAIAPSGSQAKEVNECNNLGLKDPTTGECKCIDEYATLARYPTLECIYRKKSKTITIFLSIFLGVFGADSIYLGNNFQCFIKTGIPLILFFSLLLVRLKLSNKYIFKDILFILPFFLLIFFWICDIFLTIFDFKKDGEGIELI